MNMTLSQKQSLEVLAQEGHQVKYLEYLPDSTNSGLEAAVVAQGYAQYQRQVNTNGSVEVVYYK